MKHFLYMLAIVVCNVISAAITGDFDFPLPPFFLRDRSRKS